MRKIYATTNADISEREKRNMERSRRLAAQGMVLLKNNGVLPLKEKPGKIALYGNGARKTVKGGTGSGDVNSRFVVSIEQGLEHAGYTVTTKQWLDRYDRAVEASRNAYYSVMKEHMRKEGMNIVYRIFLNPFIEPPVVSITHQDVVWSDTDTALYVITRNSGEGKDRKNVPGQYQLYAEEKEALRVLEKNYKHVIVILNVGGVIDLNGIHGCQGIDAVLLMSQAGCCGGDALVDVLRGCVTPSGHLTATWAKNYDDYPNAQNYGANNGNLDDEYYTEGIYVGYRYFDSFNVEPAYPFGYGLSYTTFDIKVDSVTVLQNQVNLSVCVKNTGNTYDGQEVVQIYASAPAGRIEKPYQELVAFKKTKRLSPGESQTVHVSFDLEALASYDVKTASYVLEKGEYCLRIGNHSRNTKIEAVLHVNKDWVVEKMKNLFEDDRELNEFSSKGNAGMCFYDASFKKETAHHLYVDTTALETRICSYRACVPHMPVSKIDTVITFEDVCSKKNTLDELISQLSVEELAAVCVGEIPDEESFSIGAESRTLPGADGETTSKLYAQRGIPSLIFVDGPNGIRLHRKFYSDGKDHVVALEDVTAIPEMKYLLDELPKPAVPENAVAHYQYATALPVAVLQAQSWDEDVLREIGDIAGEEIREFGGHIYVAPGLNIHRNPLCGRNFEYYSEDPLLSGLCAAAVVNGTQKWQGAGAMIKHFAANNQEDNRTHNCVHVSERALREIYLKGFEIAIKKSSPKGILSSYNLINGVHAANSRELLLSVVRDEWKFDGLITCDWGTTHQPQPWEVLKYGSSDAAGCMYAGNNLIMPGSKADMETIIQAINHKQGKYDITLDELRWNAKCILKVLFELTSGL